MFELTINGEVYQFKFGIGFVREMNRAAQIPVPGIPGASQEVGFALVVTKILDGDVVALADALEIANKGFKPRATRTLIEGYIDDESTDIDELFSTVTDFLEKANATKQITKKMREALEEATKEEPEKTE